MQENINSNEAIKDINDAHKRNNEIKTKEKIVEFILLAEATLILITIFPGILSRTTNNSKQIYQCPKTPIHQFKDFNKFYKP